MSGRTRTSLALTLLLAAPALAGTEKVDFLVPVKAQLDLRDRDTVTVMPFLVATEEGEAPIERRGVNVQEEFENYMKRLLRRRTSLDYQEPPPIDYPTFDLQALARDSDFWRVVGERAGADLILTGSLDFDIQDRSGYRTEEYTSPFDGRTYYRQVLVEQTGFEYDIVLQVYDGRDGKLLHTDNFKDFRQFEGEGADPLAGMFENLQALEDRIAGVFARKNVPTTRVLYTD
ncbi:MAG: hypothetical protein R2991_08835 [Thermoanaerobaculia bacterium]